MNSQPKVAQFLTLALLTLALPSAAPAIEFGLAAAVLPGSRSAIVGSPVTVYATLANASALESPACSIALATPIPASFAYQTTDAAANTPTGTPNTPVDIAAGGAQSFIITLTPTSDFGPTDVEFRFECANSFAATRSGLNTLFMSASSTPVPDIFARARTLTNTGIVDIPAASLGTGIFTVAATNAGAVDGDFLVFAEPSNDFTPVQVFICESDPMSGLCLSPPAETVTTTMPAGASRTFTAFVQALGETDSFFDPDFDRILVAFLDFDAGIVRSQTSVAMQFVPPPVPIASVLPSSRSVQVGDTATAYAAIVNTGIATASGCSISPRTSVPAGFSYQTSDPATNALTGTPDTPVDIAAGQLQTFVFGFTPTAAFNPTEIQLNFDCRNSGAAPVVSGVNTFLLSASNTPVPDLFVRARTATNDGILYVPGPAASGSIAVAVTNVGSTGTLSVSADTGSVSLPANILLCETDPVTASCVDPAAPTATTTIASGATSTFAVFVTALGDVPFDAATNRILVRFTDGTGVERGGSSVAVTTYNDNFVNAIPLTDLSGTTTADNSGATKELGEPAHGGSSGGKSLWWRWTAASSGSLTVDTFGSGFDTTLGVYTGTRVDALTTIASNDDSGGSGQSAVSFDVTSGTEYYIAVDSFFADFNFGAIVLNWGP